MGNSSSRRRTNRFDETEEVVEPSSSRQTKDVSVSIEDVHKTIEKLKQIAEKSLEDNKKLKQLVEKSIVERMELLELVNKLKQMLKNSMLERIKLAQNLVAIIQLAIISDPKLADTLGPSLKEVMERAGLAAGDVEGV